MSRDRSRQLMSWTFNRVDARNALKPIGARNLTTIESIIKNPDGYILIDSYSKMVEHNYTEADEKALEWMDKITEENARKEGRYIYFRFLRLN